MAEAARLFLDGKGLQARAALVRLAAQTREPAVRAQVLEQLLDICQRMQADACLGDHTQAYVDALGASLSTEPGPQAVQVFKAAYAMDAWRFAIGSEKTLADALADPVWKADIPQTGWLYLRRRLLRSNLVLAAGTPAEADRAVSEVLAIVGSANTSHGLGYDVAAAIVDALGTLVQLGEYERAAGLHAAAGTLVAAALPPRAPEVVFFHRTSALLFEAIDDGPGTVRETEAELAALADIEFDPDVREWLLADALSMKAALCARRDLACPRQTLEEHPYAGRYRTAGRLPASVEELSYLAARGVAAILAHEPDPVAAAALSGKLAFTPTPSEAPVVDAYRLGGLALSRPPGAQRQAALADLGRRLSANASIPSAPGAWYRPGVLDRLLIGLALAETVRDPRDAETAFALVQLAARAGPGFDADAMTAFGRVGDAAQRAKVHDVLRLRARRDREEQVAIRLAAARAVIPGDQPTIAFDLARLAELNTLSARLADAERALDKSDVATSGANLVSLARLKSVLAPDEAALAFAPVGGGLAYACVRREGMTLTAAPADTPQIVLDARLIQASLSATHAPSEELDRQFPVTAAVRLHDALLKPFAPCLKPGDRILWLPGLATTGLPLGALLARAPPRTEGGWDLAAADWVVKAHAISYPGSASAVVAARTAQPHPSTGADFLGVGDPALSGPGAARVREAGLGPLPETAAELAASARPFAAAQTLTGPAATEAGVRAALARPWRLISFATHGVMRGEVEGLTEPALILTPVVGGDGADDGLFTASEIADFNLTAAFVALSACNTANLSFTRIAQDLPALASAFAVAGVPSTLGTLWPVNSAAGAQVVADLFGRLAAGAGPAEALASAQRAFLAAPPGPAYLHPRFWAPFVILGDGGPAPYSAPRAAATAAASASSP